MNRFIKVFDFLALPLGIWLISDALSFFTTGSSLTQITNYSYGYAAIDVLCGAWLIDRWLAKFIFKFSCCVH